MKAFKVLVLITLKLQYIHHLNYNSVQKKNCSKTLHKRIGKHIHLLNGICSKESDQAHTGKNPEF